MRKLLLLLSSLSIFTYAFSQEKAIKEIKEGITKRDAEAHLTFLAADEMRGRDTGSPEIAIAANYIATQFRISGLKFAGTAANYFQEVGLLQTLPPKIDFRLGNDIFKFKEDLLMLSGKSKIVDGDVVFAGYGSDEDFNGLDVKGKIVVTYAGTSESSSVRQAFRRDAGEKNKRVSEKGAAALIEIAGFQDVPWPMLSGFLGSARFLLDGDAMDSGEMPHIWLRKSDRLDSFLTQKKSSGKLTVAASLPRSVPAKNVIGVIEGYDAKLKQEFVVLSAHYDHVGVRKNESTDSIYNGARDNGIGTTAILEAARFFSRNPAKRSILIIAFCAEEKGLLGSRWYSDHPLIPLKQTVYNLDCDGAGYNDKTIASLVDLNRTTADELLKKGCQAFGLGLGGDPAPDQNLYERSDNYNFATKGVPAVDISPGVKGLDPEILKYYHQPADEVSTLDFDYLEKFFQAYIYSAYLIANAPITPTWKAGDKFEEAGKKLYGKNK